MAPRAPLAALALLASAACVDDSDPAKTGSSGDSSPDDGTDGESDGSDGSDGDGSDGSDGSDGGDGSDGSDGGPTYPELQPAACGLDYSFLALDEMGTIIEHELDSGFSLPAATLQALLDAQGYGDAVEVRYDVSLHKVRYLSQDRGEPIEVTGYVSFPVVEEPTDFPTALWLHPTMGFGDDCAPTTGDLVGAAFPVLWAAQGYVVAAPDYIGMAGWGAPSERLHPWIVAEPTALASLDSLRAADRLAAELETAARPDLSRVVAFGASQGGHAALFADHFARAYTPEIDMLAVVASIPVTDLRALSQFAATTPSEATLGLAGGMVSMWDWYGRQAPLSDVLQPALAETLPGLLPEACEDFGELVPGVEGVEDVFTPGFIAAAAAGELDSWDPWSCYMDESSLLRNQAVEGPSPTPKLIITGSEDTLAWAPPVRADAVALCEQGVPVEYIECSGLGHVDAAVRTLPLMIDWATRQLAGETLTACILNEPAPCEG